MIYVVRINDKEYEVEVERGTANIVNTADVVHAPVLIQQNAAPVQMAQAAPVPSPVQNTSPTAASGETVKSPMPGTILDIKVGIGTKVKKGHSLLILEAMKMENEIIAAFDGIVTHIHVAKGATVSTGDSLIVIA
ncbi:MAG: biotin/lipoyl-containing protein [Saccharofermentanales bacterium]